MVHSDELVGNKSALRLILFLAEHPIKYSFTRLQRQTKLAKATLMKWLPLLVKESLLTKTEIGRNRLYKVKAEDMRIKQLKILHTLTKLIPLRELAKKYNVEVYLYGSSARGEDKEQSDLDILVLGEVPLEKFAGELGKIGKKLRKRVQPQYFSHLEWATLKGKDPAFYERVEKDKIRLQ